jgi:HK97 family phage portal protein
MRLGTWSGWLTKALTRAGLAAPPLTAGRAWYPIVREASLGAWQQNVDIRSETALSYWAVFACVTLIAADIAKLRLRLVEQAATDVWQVVTNPAYSPVLRTPNHYQTIGQCIQQWVSSKLTTGNTYVLKERDARGVVRALYVLDPARVRSLVAPDGSVYYELTRGDRELAPVPTANQGPDRVVVPASEMIHDRFNTLFHPLVGLPPLYACGLSANHGLTIQEKSTQFFGAGSQPGGVLIVPGEITKAQLEQLRTEWEASHGGENWGRVAVVTGGLKYEQMTLSPVDTQLIEQLKWTAETIASAYHVPYFMIDSSRGVPYANSEPLVQTYYAQCLQSLITDIETSLDRGLELSAGLGTEFDIDDLVWMDSATRTKSAADSIGGGALSPNEARAKYYGLGPVAGGNSPMVQQQYYSLEALAARDASGPPAVPAVAAPVPNETDEADVKAYRMALVAALARKEWTPDALAG